MSFAADAKSSLASGNEEPRSLPQSLTRYTGFLLAKAHHRISALYSNEFRKFGTDLIRNGLLHLLGEEGPMSQQQVGRKLRVDRTTVAKVVDSLASARLVSRKDDPNDRRIYLVEITAEGRKALAVLQRTEIQIENQLLVGFNGEERIIVRRGLLALAG